MIQQTPSLSFHKSQVYVTTLHCYSNHINVERYLELGDGHGGEGVALLFLTVSENTWASMGSV